MKDLKSRVAYLQGLSAGLDLDAGSKESKLLSGIIEVLNDFAQSMSDLEDGHEQLEEFLESIDEDLYQLEDEIYEEDTADYHEVDCPGCGETVYFDAGIIEADDIIEVTCPNCGEVVFANEHTYLNEGKPKVYNEQLTGNVAGKEEEDI